MIEGLPYINIAVDVAGIMVSLLGIVQTIIFRHSIARKTRYYFLAFFTFLTLDLFAMAGADLIVVYGSASRTWHNFYYFCHYLFCPLEGCAVTVYLLSRLDPEHKKKTLWRVFFVFEDVYFALLLLTPATGLYWYIDAENVYRQGPGYWISVLCAATPLLLNMTLLVLKRKKLTIHERIAFWVYCAPPTAACVLQLFVKGIHFIIPAGIIAAITMFTFILLDQVNRYHQQEREKEEMRVSMMLSQIQPHFLFNTLTAIYETASASPETQKAISDFAEYLRGNIDSLKKKVLIPFSTERRHVETYLKLEQLSLEDHLRYSFDCETEAFLLPALTVQPLVENAVKHGVSKRKEGGSVKVTARENADHWAVTVSDDGVGIDPSRPPEDRETHVGIENARQRLQMMCGGTLTIESVPGEGTVATITIPKRRQEK